jgi:hypothetical protein
MTSVDDDDDSAITVEIAPQQQKQATATITTKAMVAAVKLRWRRRHIIYFAMAGFDIGEVGKGSKVGKISKDFSAKHNHNHLTPLPPAPTQVCAWQPATESSSPKPKSNHVSR